MRDFQFEEDLIEETRKITRIEDIQDQSPRTPGSSVSLITKKAIFEKTAQKERKINLASPKKLEMQQWYWMVMIHQKSCNYKNKTK